MQVHIDTRDMLENIINLLLLVKMLMHKNLRLEVTHVWCTRYVNNEDARNVLHSNMKWIHHDLPYWFGPPNTHTYIAQWNHLCWIQVELATLAHVKWSVGESGAQVLLRTKTSPLMGPCKMLLCERLVWLFKPTFPNFAYSNFLSFMSSTETLWCTNSKSLNMLHETTCNVSGFSHQPKQTLIFFVRHVKTTKVFFFELENVRVHPSLEPCQKLNHALQGDMS